MLLGMLLREAMGTLQEKEYAYVAMVADFNELEEKASEVHEIEQWFLMTNRRKNNGIIYGTIRVRSTDGGNYTLTVKEGTEKKGIDIMQDQKESTVDISKEMFDSFKNLAPRDEVKTRYVFPVPDKDYKWEVDVYTTADGDTSDWCKIDLEVRRPLKNIPDFPVALDMVVDMHSKSAPEREYASQILDKLIIRRRDSILPLFS